MTDRLLLRYNNFANLKKKLMTRTCAAYFICPRNYTSTYIGIYLCAVKTIIRSRKRIRFNRCLQLSGFTYALLCDYARNSCFHYYQIYILFKGR